jgi:hypothetical protein
MDRATYARRTVDLVLEELADGLLVHDAAAEVGHVLEPLAARVWQACGEHGAELGEIARVCDVPRLRRPPSSSACPRGA